MNKSLKWIIIGVATVLVLGYIGLQVMQYQTKKLSPEDTVVYDNGHLNLEIFYNRPYKTVSYTHLTLPTICSV